jgi:hypothetical protein
MRQRSTKCSRRFFGIDLLTLRYKKRLAMARRGFPERSDADFERCILHHGLEFVWDDDHRDATGQTHFSL